MEESAEEFKKVSCFFEFFLFCSYIKNMIHQHRLIYGKKDSSKQEEKGDDATASDRASGGIVGGLKDESGVYEEGQDRDTVAGQEL